MKSNEIKNRLLKAVDDGNYSEIKKVVDQLFVNNNVYFANYDRTAVMKSFKDSYSVYSIIKKINLACKNIVLIAASQNGDNFIADKASDLNMLVTKQMIESFVVNYMLFGEHFLYSPVIEAGNNRGKLLYSVDKSIKPMGLPAEVVDIKADSPLNVTGYVIEGMISNVIPASDVIHIKSYNPDWKELHSVSPIKVASKLIDKINATDEVEVKNFQNGGPSHLISAEKEDAFSDEQYVGLMSRLRKLWTKYKGGIVGTSANIKVTPIGISPLDMGTIESNKNATKMLCAVWNLDAGIFDTTTDTYDNKATKEKAIYTQCAIPLMQILADAINEKFEHVYGKKIIIDTSSVDSLRKNISETIKSMRQASAFTDNEIRQAADYDKLPENGDIVWKDSGLIPLDDALIDSDSNGSNEPIMS